MNLFSALTGICVREFVLLAWWVTLAFTMVFGVSLAEIRPHSQEADTRDVTTRLQFSWQSGSGS
jgi:hypothetical protein